MGPAVGAVYKAQANEELDNGFRSRMGGYISSWAQTFAISLDRRVELASMSPRATAAMAEAADGASNAIVIRHSTWIGIAVARADVVSGREMEMQLVSA